MRADLHVPSVRQGKMATRAHTHRVKDMAHQCDGRNGGKVQKNDRDKVIKMERVKKQTKRREETEGG